MSERNQSSAFTLIELLVSMTVACLLAFMLMSMLNHISRTWQQAQARIEPRKSGRAILDYLSRDLQLAELPRDRSMFYASAAATPQASQLSLQFLVNPPQISSNKYFYPQAAFWQVPSSAGTNAGMAEVGYFVRWIFDGAGKPHAMLCRFLAPQGDPNFQIYSDPSHWISDTIIEAVAPGVENSSDPTKSYRGWFADNVIGLWVKCLDPLGNPIVTNALGTAYLTNAYDSRLGYAYSSGGKMVTNCGYKLSTTSYQILAEMPALAEVELVILDSRAASRLTTVPTNYSATNAQAFLDGLPDGVRQGARVFSTRVKLKNSSGN